MIDKATLKESFGYQLVKVLSKMNSIPIDVVGWIRTSPDCHILPINHAGFATLHRVVVVIFASESTTSFIFLGEAYTIIPFDSKPVSLRMTL